MEPPASRVLAESETVRYRGCWVDRRSAEHAERHIPRSPCSAEHSPTPESPNRAAGSIVGINHAGSPRLASSRAGCWLALLTAPDGPEALLTLARPAGPCWALLPCCPAALWRVLGPGLVSMSPDSLPYGLIWPWDPWPLLRWPSLRLTAGRAGPASALQCWCRGPRPVSRCPGWVMPLLACLYPVPCCPPLPHRI